MVLIYSIHTILKFGILFFLEQIVECGFLLLITSSQFIYKTLALNNAYLC